MTRYFQATAEYCTPGPAALTYRSINPPLQLPAGASLPFGRFQARGVLTAVQHTVALERCVQAVGEVRQALGEAAPPLAEGYATAMQRLQAVDSPHLHCMALPGGSGGSLPALVRRALESTAVLGIEYHLGE